MPEDKDHIEDLKQSLYSRTAPDINTRRKLRFTEQTSDLKKDWEHPVEPPFEDEEVVVKNKSMSFFTKLFIGSLVFCVIAVGTGAYIFFNGGNFISGNNITVDINGPVSVPGGTPVSLNITVTNKNTVALKNTELAVRFPAGTTDPNDTTKSLEDYIIKLGDIAPGDFVSKSVEAVVFGEQNLQKSIISTVTYGIAGSSATFTKQTSYDILINSSPVNLTISTLKETISGKPFDVTISIKSNSANTLKNVLLKGTYPFGYTFDSASVKPASSDNTTWSLGDMPPGSEKKITIHGKLTGEDTDVRAFRFTVGSRSQQNPLAIGTSYMEAVEELSIQKPFLSLNITVNNNNSSEAYSAQYGKNQTVNIRWTNNLPESLNNVILTAELSGSAYNKSDVSVYDGFFRSVSNEIVWNRQTNPEFASIQPGGSGFVTFSITPSQGRTPTENPEIVVRASASGDRSGATNVPLSTAETVRNIRIASSVSLSGRVLRQSGALQNYGPIPPVAEQKTSYSIIWSVDNTSNTVGNAIVTASLPAYVTWIGKVSPSSEDITYDKNSGIITWNIGSVNTYTLGTTGRREVEFQVELLPSITQVGQAPTLVNEAKLTATDTWTRSTLESSQSFLTTSFSTDPSYKAGDDNVANPR